MITLDDDISQYILNNTNVFKHIHPNYITIFGIGLNFAILHYLFFSNNTDNLGIIGLLLFLRWLADSLDGNIARKYEKTSKLGNILDTISDIMLEIIIVVYLYINIENKTIGSVIVILYAMMLYKNIFKNNVLNNHDKIKKGCNYIEDIQSFLVNNTLITFITFYVIYYFISKSKLQKLITV